MIKNYFKIAWRNLIRNKVYSAINIFGLAIGIAVCMLIMLYSGHESTYDRFHKNASRMYWIQGKVKMGNDSIFVPNMSFATAPLAKQTYPGVESFTRFIQVHPDAILQNNSHAVDKFDEKKFMFADSNFFSFFSFTLLTGDANHVLQNPFSIVISEKAAHKYFGDKNPVGETIRYNNVYNFTVTGVAAKTPSNSSIDFDFVASVSSMAVMKEQKNLLESQMVQLGSFSTYFLLKQPVNIHQFETSLVKLHQSKTPDGNSDESYIATAITDTHLNANYADSSNTKYLKIFPFAAALVLLLALINYMSLSTARATLRSKEIGVRKVMGAKRKAIAAQFFIESALYTSVAFVLGYFLCSAIQPVFFNFLQIDIDNSFLHNSSILFSFLGLFIVTVILAATYPSILLSACKPVMVLYGKLSKNSSGISVRRFFTVFQFTISIILIICGIVIEKQMYFFRHKDTGVNRDNIVMIPFASTIGKHYTAFKKEALSLSAIEQVTTAHYPMYKGYDIFFAKAKNSHLDVSLPILSVDENFIPMLGLKWKIAPPDSLYYVQKNAVVLNESAVEKLNLGNEPLKETVALGDPNPHIMGVLKDFNYQSLQGKIGALCLFITKDNDTASAWGKLGGCLFAKIKPNADIASTVSRLEASYKKYDAESPFQFYFMDSTYEAMYKAEDRLAKISGAFIVFTLLIACLGLLGLVTFMAEQRTKEIGIRKVLGASVASITTMLSKDFLLLVIIAIVIASPIAWWAMSKWLQGFAYRVSISWWIFAAAGAVAIFIAMLIVSAKTINAANANPVKSLRSE